ncbi:MAG: DUF2330 domain-containing protein [Candidatus Thermoplasmatota archaeon]|nr:DUF2330 domain-containing protein [Candidatus Thermoplasmatota archaeon]
MDCPGKRKHLVILFGTMIIFPVLFAVFVQGDGGFVPVMDINVYEPGQNAIVCWNGEKERMYLSINIYAEEPTEGIHFVPFPSLPKVSLGDFETFERMKEVFLRELDFNSYANYGNGGGQSGGGGDVDSFEIKFTAKLGSHSITVIQIISPDDFYDQIGELMEQVGSSIENWPQGLEDVLVGYCNKGFSYFAIDRFQIGNEPGSVEPLVYDFRTDELVFPLEVSSILKGDTSIKLALITPEDHPIDLSGMTDQQWKRGEGILDRSDVLEIDPSLDELFEGRCIGQYFEIYTRLSELKGDFLIPTLPGVSWCTSANTIIRYVGDEGWDDGKLIDLERYFQIGSDELRLVDESRGEVLWTTRPLEHLKLDEDLYCHRNIEFDDMNGDGSPEIVLVDQIYNRTDSDLYISRLSHENGDILWSRNIPTESYVEGFFPLTGYYQTLFVIHTRTEFHILSLKTGSSWNTSSYSSSLKYGSISKIRTSEAEMILLQDTEEGKTFIIDPWHGEIKTLWSVDAVEGVPVTFMSEELLRFRENGYYEYRNTSTGEIRYAYATTKRMLGEYFDTGAPGRFNGLLISYQYPNLNISKVSISDHSIIWTALVGEGKGLPAGTDYYTCSFIDINGDGFEEIVASIPGNDQVYRGNREPSKLSTIVLDGMNGSLLFTSEGKIMGILGSGQTDGPKICLNERYHITLYDLRSNTCLLRSEKRFPLSGEVLRSMKDINNDGCIDIITSTYNLTYSYYGYNEYKGDAFINGYTQRCEYFIPVDTWIGYQCGAIVSGAEGRILYREGYRLYSRSIETRLMLEADSDEVYSDGTVRFFLKARDDSVPARLDNIRLSSDPAIGTFMKLKEVLPGLYSFEWKAPGTYTGEATITARVIIDDMPFSEARKTITVLRGPNIIEEIVSINVYPSISKRSVELNDPVLVQVDITGTHDPLLLSLKLFDLSLCGIVSQPMKTYENRYIGSFIPVREVDISSLLLEVRYNDELIKRLVWSIDIIAPMIEKENEEILLGDPQVFPAVVGPGEQALLFIPFSGTDRSDDLRVVCDDDEKGTFSNFRILMGSLMVIDYIAPLAPGPVTLSIRVYMEANPVGSVHAWLSVVEDPATVVQTPTGLEASYVIVRGGDRLKPQTDIFITVKRDNRSLSNINYIQVNSIPGVYIKQGTACDNATLHLLAEHPSKVVQPIQIMIWDEFGTSEMIDIELKEIARAEDEALENEPASIEKEEDDNGWYVAAAVVGTLIVSMLTISIAVMTWDQRYRDN